MSASQSKLNHGSIAELEAPRYESGKAMLIAGLRRRYIGDAMNQMPDQWQQFARHIGRVQGQVGHMVYGLSFLPNNSQGVEYLSGVEVSSCSGLPDEFSCVGVPAQKYAVFVHRGHVSTVRETCEAIGTRWLPESGLQVAPATDGAPDFFERYTPEFDPQNGMGGIEVWIPIK